MRLVMNSSTTILLAKIGLLKIIDEQFKEVLISKEVYREAVEDPKKLGYEDAVITEKEVDSGRIKKSTVKNKALVQKLMHDFTMMRGEAETLVLAIERKADILATDDYQCMRAARALELPYTQAISLVITLFERNKIKIETAQEAIDQLQEYGWYADWILEDAKSKIKG